MLAYGRTGLSVDFPKDRTTVLEPSFVEGLPDQERAIEKAIQDPINTKPLSTLVSSNKTVAISVCDLTRPIPTHTILPVILNALKHVPKNQITILIATGTHRANSTSELKEMLGNEIVTNYSIENHDAFDQSTL